MGILLAIHILVTLLLIFVVLIQKNEGGSSLFANSGGAGMFNARGTSNILTKATWVLSSLFLLNCIVMATIASHDIKSARTIIEQQQNRQTTPPETKQDAEESSSESAPLSGSISESVETEDE